MNSGGLLSKIQTSPPNFEDMQVLQIARRSQDLGLKNKLKITKIGGRPGSYECPEPYQMKKCILNM